MNFTQLAKRAERLVADNSTVILTSVGVVGVVGTAVLTGKASVKAVRVIEAYEREIEEGKRANLVADFSAKEKVLVTWRYFIPPVTVGSVTIAAIIFANRIGTRRAAVIAAAYTISEKAFDEYREKVVETIGEAKEQKVRAAIAQDRVDGHPVSGTTVFVGNGDVLCLEAYTMRYFMSSYELIRRAENVITAKVLSEDYASLGDLYYELKLKRTPDCEDVGWNSDKLPKIDINATVAEDGKPCLVMSYDVTPIRNYHRFH